MQDSRKPYQRYQDLLLQTQAGLLDTYNADTLALRDENQQDGQEHCDHLKSQQEAQGPLWDNMLSMHRASRRVSVLYQVLL